MSRDVRHEEFMRQFLGCQPRISAFIRSLVFSRADADDVLQETALVLWEKFDQFEPGTRFDRWAFRIAHFQVMYHRKKKARERVRFSDTLVEQLGAEIADDAAGFEEAAAALHHCVDRLPGPDRDLIRERYRGDTTNRDIAHRTGRSESAISRALNRVYLKLLQCIEGTLAHGDGLRKT